jgi:hypothetical protein
MNALVVPPPAIQSNPIKAFPKTPARVRIDHVVERIHNFSVVRPSIPERAIVRRSREPYGGAGSPGTHFVVRHQESNCLALF